MSAWILSVAGIVTAGVLIDILLPEGDSSKYVKGVFALIVVLVIVTPAVRLFSGGDLDLGFDTDAPAYSADDSFVDGVNSDRASADEEKIERSLAAAGYEDCSVNIFAAASDVSSAERVNVNVSACDAYSAEDDDEIKEIIKKCVNCSEVRIYG